MMRRSLVRGRVLMSLRDATRPLPAEVLADSADGLTPLALPPPPTLRSVMSPESMRRCVRMALTILTLPSSRKSSSAPINEQELNPGWSSLICSIARNLAHRIPRAVRQITRTSALSPAPHLARIRGLCSSWLKCFSRLAMLGRLLQLGCVFALVAATTPGSAPVLELKPPRGIDFTLQNSPTPQKYLIETMPGGVALLDYNNDGLLDIFLVNGGRITNPMQLAEKFDRKDPRYWNRLYRQNRDGTFTDVTVQAGLANAGDGNYGMGVAVGDYDNDGFADIYVTNFGKNILYHNNGDGTFTDVTAKAGVAAGGWSVSAGFFDYDNDGKLDLFVTRYLDWTPETSKTCGR